jgi:hypothetical protein
MEYGFGGSNLTCPARQSGLCGPFATAGEPLVRTHFSGVEAENPLRLLNTAIAFHEAGRTLRFSR